MNENEILSENGTIKLSDAAWAIARERAEIICPIVEQKPGTISTAIKIASTKLNLSKRTIYYYLRKWKESDKSIAVFAPKISDGGKGKYRLTKNAESILSDAINNVYLSRQKISVAALYRNIRRTCKKSNIFAPSLNTIRSRIKQIQRQEVLLKREGRKEAQKLNPIIGSFPAVNYPLEIVQIDHSRVDIIIVDPYTRQALGRPWITLAIDIYTRCIIGLCLTLEAPSATSVGLCLAHMVTNKNYWLERIGARTEWPMYGKPKIIHVDNGTEFHSEALRRGCDVHGIKITYRPVATPHYGGIVERVIGTMMKMVHELPGTTFSNIAERGNYNSEKEAALTLAELEKWFAMAIFVYHKSYHSGVFAPPISLWKKSISSGWKPFYIQNAKNFLIDFLPIVSRQIQRQGFVVNHITYMNSALKPWISNMRNSCKFIIRYDPRDLSRIYALHPDENHYVEVPYRSMSNISITLWEHKAAIKRIREEGRKEVTEEEIIKIIENMRSITNEAINKTKSARKALNRREHLKIYDKSNSKKLPIPETRASKLKDVKLFEEIEEW